MRPTSSLLGASRLPLTSKRGKDTYYKGSGQSQVPGGGHRTGPPGAHVVRGRSKYRVIDTKVRFFVGPGIDKIESSPLKPYVTTAEVDLWPENLPSFSPQPPLMDGKRPQRKDFKSFSKAYANLTITERNALIMDTRRNYYDALAKRFPAPETAKSATEEEIAKGAGAVGAQS